MKKTRQYAPRWLFLLALVLLVQGSVMGTVQAVNINNGQQLYESICASCHGLDPRQNQNNIRRAANNPSLIAAAISSLVPNMSFLRGALTNEQIEDIAAFVGNVLNPSSGTPLINAAPSTMNFGNVSVGTTSPGQSLTITNGGSGALIFSGITVTPADFVIFSGCPGTLDPGGMCFISVQFAPHAAGGITGSLTLSHNAVGSPLVIALSGTGGSSAGTAAVVEYYAPSLDHYFITSDPEEQAFIDGGGAGNWVRTGNSFGSGGNVQVCRFYGNTAINPATGVMFGPNSHFYTADASECAYLQSVFDPTAASWQFESQDFQTTPATGGGCSNGLTPVYRAYNNGFARGIASNHRITSNLASYQQTVASGWSAEGVVMCAP